MPLNRLITNKPAKHRIEADCFHNRSKAIPTNFRVINTTFLDAGPFILKICLNNEQLNSSHGFLISCQVVSVESKYPRMPLFLLLKNVNKQIKTIKQGQLCVFFRKYTRKGKLRCVLMSL